MKLDWANERSMTERSTESNQSIHHKTTNSKPKKLATVVHLHGNGYDNLLFYLLMVGCGLIFNPLEPAQS